MYKLLVVEDNENEARLYQRELEEEGYEVILVNEGEKALKMVKQEPLHLAIMDIRMPGMDGLELLGKILGEKRRLPVIIFSGYLGYKDNFMSWAAEAYIIKSSDLTELKTSVRKLLERIYQ